MKCEIISRKCIKPSSPTPPHLKTYKFCFLDQLYPAIRANMTFFFESDDSDFPSKSHLLQHSLSQTLSLFYPFAGRLVDSSTLDCNDEGAFFLEAQANISLSDFLNQRDFDLVDCLIPTNDSTTMEMANASLLLIQFTQFACGGMGMSLTLTHKVADIASMITFLHSWTAIARGDEPVGPQWTGSSLLPPRNDLPALSASVSIKADKFVSKRFIFYEQKIAELKSKLIAKGMQHYPSRVEAILALLYKSAVAASKMRLGYFKPSALFQAVNLRTRMTPPLPNTLVGNFIWPFMILVQEETELELHTLATKMRDSFNAFCNNKVNKFSGEDGCTMMLKDLKERGEFFKKNKDLNVYKCSSWCNFPLYETDFGWGRALWHVSVNKLMSNTIAICDTRSGNGIEATVTLNEEEMALFECGKELLEFACFNPSVHV